MDIYSHAVSSKKRRAQAKVVEMILPEGNRAVTTKGLQARGTTDGASNC